MIDVWINQYKPLYSFLSVDCKIKEMILALFK